MLAEIGKVADRHQAIVRTLYVVDEEFIGRGARSSRVHLRSRYSGVSLAEANARKQRLYGVWMRVALTCDAPSFSGRGRTALGLVLAGWCRYR